MALIQGGNQSPRVTTAAINSKGRLGDPSAGVLVSTTQVSGSIVQPYGGMVGGKLTLSQQDAAGLTDSSVGQVYGGVYMYVPFSATSASVAVRGCIVAWVSPLAVSPTCYTVTPDGSPANALMVAGIAVNGTAKGNYDFIQVAGIAQVKWPTSIQQATPAVGDAIFVSSNLTSPQLADDRNGTSITNTLLIQMIGKALAPPVASTTSPVLLMGGWDTF